MKAAIRFPAQLADVHRGHWRRAHKEGLPAMKQDSLYRVALHLIAHDRALRREQEEREALRQKSRIKRIEMLVRLDWPIFIKPAQVVRYIGI